MAPLEEIADEQEELSDPIDEIVVRQDDQREVDEPSKAHVEVNKPLDAQV